MRLSSKDISEVAAKYPDIEIETIGFDKESLFGYRNFPTI